MDLSKILTENARSSAEAARDHQASALAAGMQAMDVDATRDQKTPLPSFQQAFDGFQFLPTIDTSRRPSAVSNISYISTAVPASPWDCIPTPVSSRASSPRFSSFEEDTCMTPTRRRLRQIHGHFEPYPTRENTPAGRNANWRGVSSREHSPRHSSDDSRRAPPTKQKVIKAHREKGAREDLSGCFANVERALHLDNATFAAEAKVSDETGRGLKRLKINNINRGKADSEVFHHNKTDLLRASVHHIEDSSLLLEEIERQCKRGIPLNMQRLQECTSKRGTRFFADCLEAFRQCPPPRFPMKL